MSAPAAALHSLKQGVATWSPDGRLTFANPAFARLFGAEPADLIGLGAQALIDRAVAAGAILPAQAGPPALGDGVEFARYDGATHRISVSPLDDGGSVTLALDVTEEKRNLRALAEARDLAAAADQSKSRFLRAANHDLRQPLASLKILIYSCLAADRDEDRAEALHAMDVSVSIMEDLLGALLNVGQLDAGKIQPAVATFQISTLLDRCKIQFAQAARDKGLKLAIVRSRLAVVSDRALLERILSNLVANAIRYSDVGKVLVGCRRRGAILRLIVADTGIGIAPEHHDAIFDEFFRVSDKQTDRKHSLGLGLNIAKRLADMLGHPLGLASVPGKGSLFWLDLPIGNVWHSTIGEPAINERIGGEFAGLCCLVLEDDKNLRDALTSLLERWGIVVLTVQSFRDMESVVSGLERAPDIILTDYRLQGRIQGTDLVNDINDRLEKPCPALVMTAETTPDVIAGIKRQGFPVLIKPVSPSSLRVLMHNLLFEPDLLEELA